MMKTLTCLLFLASFLAATDGLAQPASLDPKISPNVRVGEDPPELPATRRGQTEPHLARSPVDPNLLIMACMEGTGSDQGLGSMYCSYSTSTNGGLTWTPRVLIPGLTTAAHPLGADPAAAIDLAGNFYITTLAAALGNEANAMYLSKSVDRGKSLLPLQQMYLPPKGYGADKEWIAINTFPGSPTANRIAVAFTLQGGSNQVHCVYSDDGGASWSQPLPVGSRDASYALPFFFRDGSLGLFYERYMNGYMDGPPKLTYEFVRSEDGGVTFGMPNLVLDIRGSEYADPIAFGFSDPTACTDRQAGVIYAAVPAWFGTATNRAPRILFTKSIDKGRTWTKAMPVNDTPGGKGVFVATIAAAPDGQHVIITFYDKRNDPGQGYFVDLYLAESFDGGDTWEPNLRLSEFSSDLRRAPLYFVPTLGDYEGLVPAVNFDLPAVALWMDTRAGNSDPYAARIQRTRGTTFDTWRKLRFSTSDLANPAITSPQADPDGDGIPNLVEYALGLEPNHPDPNPLQILSQPGGGTTRVAYERLAVLSDIAFSWESSNDLVHWTPLPEQDTVTTAHEPSRQHVEIPVPATERVRFIRLDVKGKTQGI